jgi:hypothetical protein
MVDGVDVLRSSGTVGDMLRDSRRRRFVGRQAEVELFRAAVEAVDPPFSVLFIHGPGGIGKTSLLEVLSDQAAAAGARVVRVDGRDLPPARDALRGAFVGVLQPPDPAGRDGRVVILLDTYERIATLDPWVRTELVPELPASVLTVIAGRGAPSAEWRSDPAWRDALRVVSLRNLSPAESRRYLDECDVPSDLHDQLLAVSHGHPLGLSLLADMAVRGDPAAVRSGADRLPPELVGTLVRQFVDVIPTADQRRALEVCALARVTTEALLRDALDTDDAHALFGWLRELPFVESGPDGLQPHELARDVLDVDLRWRDVESYKRTFRGVRSHVHRRMTASHGREQQRAIFDEKYLFRNLPSILSPVDWRSWGFHYPDPAQPADHRQIVDLVRGWEGPESAAIAERWLALQPEAFFILRDEFGAVRGCIGHIDLTAAPASARDADPGAAAAWEFAQRQAPPRPGEAVLQARFSVDRDSYQGPSPTLNAGPIEAIQRELQTPNLAWDFLTLAEPERWDPYFAVADLPRAAGADFTVGDHRFGLFAHDFRKVPVDPWLELVTERALQQDFTLPPPNAAEALVLSQEEFGEAVRQALRDLHRPDLLGRNPLLRSRLVREHAGDRPADGVDLEGLLSDAVDALREHPRDDKLFRAVERTYVRPAGTQEAAAEALGVPFSTYRRHLSQGVDRVVAWLWEREVFGAR